MRSFPTVGALQNCTRTLVGVASERLKLRAACEALQQSLDACEPVTGMHQVSSMCCRALREGASPRASPRTSAYSSRDYDDVGACDVVLRHVLGVVRKPDDEAQLRRALGKATPVLRAVVRMLDATEQASTHTKAAAVRASLDVQRVRAFFSEWRVGYAWLRRPLLRFVHSPEYAQSPPSRQACIAAAHARAVQLRPPEASVARSGAGMVRASRHWEAPLQGSILRATAIPSPRLAARSVLAVLHDTVHGTERRTRLRALCAQMMRAATSRADAAERDAGAAQIILDALPRGLTSASLRSDRDAAALHAMATRTSQSTRAGVQFCRAVCDYCDAAIQQATRAARVAAASAAAVADDAAAMAADARDATLTAARRAAARAVALVASRRLRADERRAAAMLREA